MASRASPCWRRSASFAIEQLEQSAECQGSETGTRRTFLRWPRPPRPSCGEPGSWTGCGGSSREPQPANGAELAGGQGETPRQLFAWRGRSGSSGGLTGIRTRAALVGRHHDYRSIRCQLPPARRRLLSRRRSGFGRAITSGHPVM
jgi:hypothetical protein